MIYGSVGFYSSFFYEQLDTSHSLHLHQILLRNRPDLIVIQIAFDHVFIYVKIIAFADVCLIAEVGTDDDGEFHLLVTTVLQHGVAIDLRHQEIQKQEIGRIFYDDINSLLSIASFAHTHVVNTKDSLHNAEKERVVFGNDDVFL